MFKRKLGLFLTIIIFTCTYAYGGTFHYSGIPFSNIAVDADMPIWDVSGKWVWVSSNEFAAAMSETGADSITTTAGFGASINADDLENDGGVLKTAAEIPHIDVAHTWPADQIFSAVGWTPLTSATFPGSPVVNKWYLVDGTTSDPSVLEIGIPYWCIWNGSNCIAMMSNIGTLNVSAIATPTLLAAELDDAENPHTLIAGELMNKIISNVSGVMHLDAPAESEGWNVIFHCGGTDNYVIDPTDSADWYLNGTSIGATSSISNTACTIGEDMTCYSTGTKVFCKTTDSFVDLDD